MQPMRPVHGEMGPSERGSLGRRLALTLGALAAACLVITLIWAATRPTAAPPPHVPDLPEVRQKAGPAELATAEMANRLSSTRTVVIAHNDACRSDSTNDFELWDKPDPHWTCAVTQYRALEGGDDIVAGIRAWHAHATSMGCGKKGTIDSYLANYYPPHPRDQGATAMTDFTYSCADGIEVRVKPLDPAHPDWTSYSNGWDGQTRMGTVGYQEELNGTQNGGCEHPYDCLELQTPTSAEIERDLGAYQGKLILIVTVSQIYHTS